MKNIVMPAFMIGDEFDTEVLRVSANGGRGVAKHEGLVVFIPNTAPGDLVKVKVTKVQKNFIEAKMIKLKKPSKSRITPACPVFEECGGCSLQMLKISEQHRQKEGFLNFTVKSVFKNQKGIKDLKIEPIKGTPKVFGYRNRIQIHQEGNRLGFYKKGSHKLICIDNCLVADERITAKFPKLKKQNCKRRVEMAVNHCGQVVQSEKSLSIGQTLFSQVNTDLNKALIKYILVEAQSIDRLKYIQDLYCGSGNFSFPFAEKFPDSKVTAVELNKASVQTAKEKNVLKNLEFIATDVSKYLKTARKADLILVDPPRKGMVKDVVKVLLVLNVENIFYISCDLSSAARDLRLLSAKYKLLKAKPFDMFPQTEHLESFFRLKLK